jgi:hypothetical protein
MTNQGRNRIIFSLCLVAILVALALYLSNQASGVGDGMQIMIFDEDYSDSFFGWLIAIPILIFAAIVTAVVLAGTGVLVAAVLAMAAVVCLLALFFALAASILPLAVFVAIPILAVVGLVKLARR